MVVNQTLVWSPNAPTPDVLQDTPGLCLCSVILIHNADPLSGYPENVNYAQAFTYDVLVQTPNGMVRVNGVVPSPERWPRPWLVQAFRDTSPEDGEPVILPGAVMNGQFYLTVREERWAAPCGWVPSSGGDGPPPGGSGPVITPGTSGPPSTIGPGDGIAPIRENPRIFPDPIEPVPFGGGG